MNRRKVLQSMLVAPLAITKTVIPSEPMSFEDELRKILSDSPHLSRFTPSNGSKAVYLDGVEHEWVLEIVADPRPGMSVRGAIRVACLDADGRPYANGDEIASEWLIGQVRWEPAKEE